MITLVRTLRLVIWFCIILFIFSLLSLFVTPFLVAQEAAFGQEAVFAQEVVAPPVQAVNKVIPVTILGEPCFERSDCDVFIDFVGSDGVPAIPTSLVYTIHDEKTRTKLANAVTVAPNAHTRYRITIPKLANKLVSPTQYPKYSEEIHTITGTVIGSGGAEAKFYGTFLVRNLTFVE